MSYLPIHNPTPAMPFDISGQLYVPADTIINDMLEDEDYKQEIFNEIKNNKSLMRDFNINLREDKIKEIIDKIENK